jgi:hypothetical protein
MAFCANCGTKLDEGVRFCSGCGSAVGGVSNTPVEPATNVSAMPSKAAAEENISTTTGTNDFKEFVDNHIRTTTKFQSADDLIKNCKPSIMPLWVCFGAVTLVCTIGMTSEVGIFEGILYGFLLGYVALFIVSGIIRFYYGSKKTSGKFEGSINTDELIQFLNEHLTYLYPYLNKWGYMKQSAGLFLFSKIEGGLESNPTKNESKPNVSKEVYLCSGFESKQKCLATICFRPDYRPKMNYTYYIFGAEKNGVSIHLNAAVFLRHICLFKTAPILQAAMKYYLNITKSQG